MTLRFVEGCDFKEFNQYLTNIGQYTKEGELERLKAFIGSKHFNLIVFRENNDIIGHAIWHETNTEEHRKGEPREEDDRKALHSLLGENKNFIELHELWLTSKNRGKGYGKKFFDFFEAHIRNKGYESLVFYAFDPAAMSICRKRGYIEAYGVRETGPYGNMETAHVFYRQLREK
jgi:GNAT superfamily N-acetyltransferase